jgi:DNA-binding NtrC family response regulator
MGFQQITGGFSSRARGLDSNQMGNTAITMVPKRTVLLVDDEVSVRNVFQLYFETHDYAVSSASSIGEALRVLRGEEICVALIDIFLHEENGLELLKGIVAGRPQLPVIMISGVTYEHPLFQEALDAGAAGVFTKTLPLSQLLMDVRRVIHQAQRP